MILAIEKYGVIKGVFKGIKRLSKCNNRGDGMGVALTIHKDGRPNKKSFWHAETIYFGVFALLVEISKKKVYNN